jgi:hypothetical protein
MKRGKHQEEDMKENGRQTKDQGEIEVKGVK